MEPEAVQPKVTKQTAALDLSKRLKDFRTLTDANSQRGDCLSLLKSFITLGFFAKLHICHDYFEI